jgi:hypothetical protein
MNTQQISKLALEIQQNFCIEARRMERAVELATGGCVREFSNKNHYAVKSQTKHADYIVDIETVRCGCADFQSGHICKHIGASVLYREMHKQPKPKGFTFAEFVNGKAFPEITQKEIYQAEAMAECAETLPTWVREGRY